MFSYISFNVGIIIWVTGTIQYSFKISYSVTVELQLFNRTSNVEKQNNSKRKLQNLNFTGKIVSATFKLI